MKIIMKEVLIVLTVDEIASIITTFSWTIKRWVDGTASPQIKNKSRLTLLYNIIDCPNIVKKVCTEIFKYKFREDDPKEYFMSLRKVKKIKSSRNTLYIKRAYKDITELLIMTGEEYELFSKIDDLNKRIHEYKKLMQIKKDESKCLIYL